MNLNQALRNVEKSRIAFVGSGGKTTALFQLARSMKPPVIVTCSTHLGAWQTGAADQHIVIDHPGELDRYSRQLEGVTLFTGPIDAHDRYLGLDRQSLDELGNLADRLGLPLLIEADGSRQRPLKAPNAQEPVIPDWVDRVVLVAGLSGIGKPLNDDFIHRPEIFSRLSGLAIGETVNEDGLARELTHGEGGLKNIPPNAPKTLILNQADDSQSEAAGLRVAAKVRDAFPEVIITSLRDEKIIRVIEPVAGIVLAGGGSSRFGRPKMLLPWKDTVIIRHIVETALESGLDPVIVVLGAMNQTIRQELTGLSVLFCENPDWESGQSTSVRRGVAILPPQTGAVLFLLSDQPQITVDLIQALIDRHQTSLAAVIAPRFHGQRANPVLFDQSTFRSLLALQGDTGGRAIFPQFPPQFLDWEDENILLDIDTPDDYEGLRG